MQKSTKTLTAVTAAGAIAMLALAGCSSDPEGEPENNQGGPTPQSNVYDFKTPSYAATEGELTIQLPDELREVAGDDVESLPISSMTATSRDLDSAKYCAVDLDIEYANGGSETLMKNYKMETVYVLKYSHAEVIEIVEDIEAGSNKHDDLIAETGISDPYELGTHLANLEVAEKPKPEWYAVIRALTLDEGQLASDLDTADPEPGTYLSEDYETLTFVQSCTTAPMDDRGARHFVLPTAEGGVGQVFASFDIATMKDGTIGITDGGVSDYQLDSNGDWIAD